MGKFSSRDWWDPRRLYAPSIPAGRLMLIWGLYLYPMLVIFILGVSLGFVENQLGYYTSSPLLDALDVVLYPALFLAGILIIIRRLKDLGKSGWFLLLAVIPLINFVFALWLLFAPGIHPLMVAPISPTPTLPPPTTKVPGAKYCGACGGELKGRPQFCIHCGAMVPSSTWS